MFIICSNNLTKLFIACGSLAINGYGATWDVADMDNTFEVVCWSEVLSLVTLGLLEIKVDCPVALRLRSLEGSDIDLEVSMELF